MLRFGSGGPELNLQIPDLSCWGAEAYPDVPKIKTPQEVKGELEE